jgi:threonine dehydratase
MSEVGFQDIRAAARRIAPLAHRTPVMANRSFDERAGVEAYFKCENFQRGGAFKIRGAANFLYSMDLESRPRGVVGFSSGNHAQAVAIAAQSLGMKATLVMPDDAPKSKMEATAARGATIVVYDRHHGSREAIGKRIAEETGATLVPPFDHPWIIAGQGTCGLELLEERPDLDGLVVCLGGGGLLAGCAIAAQGVYSGLRIFGVEPALGNDWWLSRREGRRVEIDSPATIADGLRTTCPGVHTFPIVQKLVEDILLVTEEEIKDTVKFLMSRMKIVVEPSGAVAAAAVLHGKIPAGIRRLGIILSGGNVDLDVLAAL